MNVDNAIAEVDFTEFGFTKKVERQIVKYVHDNAEYMHEVSADMVLKVAELAFLYPDEWKHCANMVVLSHQGRMRKLLNQ